MTKSRWNDKRADNRCESKHRLDQPDSKEPGSVIQCVWTPDHKADGSDVFAYHLGPEERTPYDDNGKVRHAWIRRVWTDDEAIPEVEEA